MTGRPLTVPELDDLADRALRRALAAARDDEPEVCLMWLDHVVCLRALERTREVEVIAAMEADIGSGWL